MAADRPERSGAKRPRGRLDRGIMRIMHLSPGERRWSALVIAMVVAAIGVADELAGTRISFISFYLFPVAAAVVCHGRGAGLVTALASFAIRVAGDIAAPETRLSDAWLWWNSVGGLVVLVVVVAILDALKRLYRRAEDTMEARTVELAAETLRRQELQRELVGLSESERGAIGRELHDQLGQHLVGTALAAQVLARRLAARDEEAAREARQIADLLEQGVAQTRQVAHGLALTRIEPSRLGAEFEELCAVLRKQYPRCACVSRVGADAEAPDAETAAQLFRIGQEALRNALRHAGASRVELVLVREAGGIVLRVEDDGRGLPPDGVRGPGLGLAILRHRAEVLGASLHFDSGPGRGTRVVCSLPDARRESAAQLPGGT